MRARLPLRPALRIGAAFALGACAIAAFAAPAHAQAIANMVNAIPDAFNNVRAMEGALRTIAWATFGALVLIEVAFAIGFLWMNGRADLPSILGLLFRQGVMIGFFALLIQIAPDFCRDIIKTMVQAGNSASIAMGGSQNMSPGDVINIGFNMVKVVWDSLTWSPKSLVLVLCGAIIIWTFAEIVGAIIEVTIEGYIFSSWAVLMMGFGGNSYTRDIAIAQLRLALGIGAKRFVLQGIVAMGEVLMVQWSASLRAGTLDVLACLAAVVVSIVLYRLSQRLPQRAQDLICGVHTGGGYTGSGGLAQTGRDAVAGAAKAGVATAAMGAAAGAAYDQAKSQLEATGGKGGGGSGSGSGQSEGLGSTLARGAKLAALTASNMGQAAATDFGNRLAGERQASHGYLGARMARIAQAEAKGNRKETAAAAAKTPATTP